MTTPENSLPLDEKSSATFNGAPERVARSEANDIVETGHDVTLGSAEQDDVAAAATGIKDVGRDGDDIDIGSAVSTSRQLEMEIAGTEMNVPPASAHGMFPAAPALENEFVLQLNELHIDTHAL